MEGNSRIKDIIAELKQLNEQRDASPLKDEDINTLNDNYQMHLETSQRINELHIELKQLEGNKIV